jgi:pimeloyl-ACP methyl ester carboxylesterase
LNCYRTWYANGPVDPALQKYEDRLASEPKISVPTIVLHGDSEAAVPGPSYRRAIIVVYQLLRASNFEGVGHCPPKEGPHSFLKGIEDLTAAAKKP